jgi:HrpA-like RNA helicase
VTIGFGILGRLNEGGTLELQQEFEGNAQEWQPTVLKMNLSGKALMLKTVNIRINEVASDFAPVPPELGYQDAIAMLKRPETFAEQR